MKIRDEDFRTRTASHTFPVPLESDATLYQVARTLLRELRRRRRRGVRLLGVGISSLKGGEGPGQLDLFDREEHVESERQRKLSRVADDLKRRFGERALLPGSLLDGLEE